MHGFGTYIWTSGQRYDGEWKVSGCAIMLCMQGHNSVSLASSPRAD